MKKSILFAGILTAICGVCYGANIHLAGDSTCATYSEARKPQKGWGQMLNEFCRQNVKVRNLAAGGRSSKSFIGEGRWKKLLDGTRPGDYVVVQFGHNDQHLQEYRHTDPETTYKEYLRIYARDAKAKKVNLIFATPVPCCRFDKNGKIIGRLNLPAYRKAMIEVAGEVGVPVIDMYQILSEKLEKIGEAEAQKYYMFIKVGEYPNLKLKKDRKDWVHLQHAGAIEFAKTFTEECKRMKLDIVKCFK